MSYTDDVGKESDELLDWFWSLVMVRNQFRRRSWLKRSMERVLKNVIFMEKRF